MLDNGWESNSKLVLETLRILREEIKSNRSDAQKDIENINSRLTELRIVIEGVRIRASFYGAISGIGAGAGVIFLKFLLTSAGG